MRNLKSLVAGVPSSGEVRTIRSPYSGEVVSEVHFAGAADLDHALEAALRAAPVFAKMPVHQRATILEKTSRLLAARAAELAQAICDEAAKPYKLALSEATRAADTFQNAAEECKRLADGAGVGVDSVPSGEGRYGIVRRFAVGPVLGISPFNFPLNLSAHKLAPAIAAGCPILLKPASQTPSAAIIMGEAALEAGVPPGALSVIPTARELADKLVEDERLKLVTFTGSPAVGWGLKARAGKKKVVLELGGNAAAVVGADADLDWAVPRLATGAFSYAGQVCISVQRILVHEARYLEFVERLTDHTRTHIKAAPPADKESILSAMIDRANADRIMGWVKEARDAGAKVRCGAEQHGNVVSAAVLTDVDPKLPISGQEAFGPVVTVASFKTWDEAIAKVNDSRYGLQAGVFTNDLRAVWQCFNGIEVGAVVHNDFPTFRVDMMPYGGVKDSGFGREGLRWSIAEMTEERLLVLWPR